MGFEVFAKSSAPLSKVPTVTLQRRGTISINRAAFNLMKEPDAVELLWDGDRRLVGFRAAPVDAPNAYPVRAQNQKTDAGPFLIAGTAFTKYYDIDTSQAVRYVPKADGDIVFIELDGPSQHVTSNREGRTKRTDSDD